jgi:hemolysin activation/secretion protein
MSLANDLRAGLFLLPLLTAAGTAAFAADAPDAGRTLQELREPPPLPRVPSAPLQFETPADRPVEPGGPQVTLSAIKIDGNTVFDDDTLLAWIGDVPGRSFDLAGLKGLADRITEYYQTQGYPFARALIPQQAIADGQLTITVVEGRYGAVQVVGEDARREDAKKFLGDLASGEVIKGGPLERASLILDDQPGYRFTPIIRPGQEVGTGDLVFRMNRADRFGGSVGMDANGNRYTGRLRGRAGLYANSSVLFGDQFNLSTIYTEEEMWSGSANYALPLGGSGLRGTVGYAQTYYQLGEEFASLDAHGIAKVVSAGLSYPAIRSQRANLSVSASYQHKWLIDEQATAGSIDKKSSGSFPFAANFDIRDGLFGGAVTYGMASWTHGTLHLDEGLIGADRRTAQTDGAFDKFNLDIARLQSLPLDDLVLFVRASAQTTLDNLDSSEDFGLGGPDGVRAYPIGEGYGDEGALAQVELRYAFESVTPYIFYDHGYVRANHNPWATGDNRRDLGGAGIGARASYHGFSAEVSAAWRNFGGEPQSDPDSTLPVFWFSAAYRF